MKKLKWLFVIPVVILSAVLLITCQKTEDLNNLDLKADHLKKMDSVNSPNARIEGILTTTCDISGATQVCIGNTRSYTYSCNFSNPVVTWSISGDIKSVSYSGQGNTTATIKFGTHYSGGTIEADGDNGQFHCNDQINVSIDPNCTCTDAIDNCGDLFSGSHSGSGYYTYPSQAFGVCSQDNGATITIYCYAADVPNRFNIQTSSGGGLVVSSGWMGYANYPGPWGQSLNTPNTKSITFTKAQSTYYLKVETSIQSQNDYWESTIICP